MKKLLVVLLALTFVFVMATVTFAVVTSSVDGKVEWTFKNGEQFGGSVDGKIVFDLAKDFGEGYSAGLKIKLTPGDNTKVDDPASTDPADQLDVDKASAVAYDGDGWIKMVKDFGTFTFQTGGLGGNAANDLAVGYDMAGNPGVKFESTSLVDGLALTVVLNDNMIVVDSTSEANRELSGNYYNYLLKGVYTADALTIGAGYQAHTMPATDPAIDSTAKDAMAVWVGYKLSDALSFGLEYASRPNENGLSTEGDLIEGSTAILAKCDYTAGALTVNGKVLMTTGSFYLIDPDDVGATSVYDNFKYGVDKGADHVDPEDGTGTAGTVIKVDVGYQITDALKATLTVEDALDGANIYGFEIPEEQLMSYKVDVTDKLTEKLSLEGWYGAWDKVTELGLKATYNFVAGLDGTLELKSNCDGVKDAEGNDNVDTYTVTLKATL